MVAESGVILIQTLHPCFAVKPYIDDWKEEDFSSFPTPFSGSMPWYGRTLASWTRVISKSGLQIESISEPVDPVTEMPLSIIFTLRARQT
jgi:hypothetical protein